jgi:hypothetical protein
MYNVCVRMYMEAITFDILDLDPIHTRPFSLNNTRLKH